MDAVLSSYPSEDLVMTLELPDELAASLYSTAAANGFDSIQSMLQNVVEYYDTQDQLYEKGELEFQLTPEETHELKQRLDETKGTETIELNEAFWDEVRTVIETGRRP
jgi:hypothetical protein